MTPKQRKAAAELMASIARTHIAGRETLHQAETFPSEIWQALAKSGLLGLSVPIKFGGLGGDYRAVAGAAHALTEQGGNLGVTLTWLGHNLSARLHILQQGSAEQRQMWLPRLASGATSLAVAISEPGAGAHPKHLATVADRSGEDFVLNGEKAYLTNGPLAELFVVLAITGQAGGRKTFSALLVTRDRPGFTETPGVTVDFLKPSPHCGIQLTDCRVPAANLLGEADTAFARISMRMRSIEDAMTCASLAGAARWQLNRFAPRLQDPVAVGELVAMASALDVLAEELARCLDRDDEKPERLDQLTAGFRGLLASLQSQLGARIKEDGIEVTPGETQMARDVAKSLDIAQSVHRIKAAKWGLELMKQDGSR